MTVTVKITGEAVFREIEAFLKSTKPMKAIVKDVKETIEERTASGKDYMSRKFKSYSTGYAKKKGKRTVDLRDTGKMLGALKDEVLSPTHGRVEIKSKSYGAGKGTTDLIANIHTTGTGKQPLREFMNISKSGIQKIVKEHYDDEILKIARRAR